MDRQTSSLKSMLLALPPLIIPPTPVFLQEFHLFCSLPPKIRERIWTKVAHQPRVIKVIQLDPRCPSFNQNWLSVVKGQVLDPGMIFACKESRSIAFKYYVRCYEKAHLRPHKKKCDWSGTSVLEIWQAKGVAELTKGDYYFINFACDIFVIEKFPMDEHLVLSENPIDYNFKFTHLQRIQRIQQIYKEDTGMAFPLLLFGIAQTRDYGVELDSVSKELIGTLGGVEAELHLREIKRRLLIALAHFIDSMPWLQVPLELWDVELR